MLGAPLGALVQAYIHAKCFKSMALRAFAKPSRKKHHRPINHRAIKLGT